VAPARKSEVTLVKPTSQRLRIRVQGRVQGVGFRPFVHGLAKRYRLGGCVRNDAGGVTLEIEGLQVEEFLVALEREQPPLMRIDRISTEALPPQGQAEFVIEASGAGERCTASIPPDAAVCDACLEDLFDPADRRYCYPFVNCTHCGPRYTITRGLPYDREQTSMAAFSMCAECRREYTDPADRRYHAQPVACPACGPAMDRSPAAIVDDLLAGRIVAIKGLGGFHLACNARDEAAVERLRRRKRRSGKPFAVMVANLPSARELALIEPGQAEVLTSVERPIVLLPGRDRLPAVVAGGLDSLGLMLPYTPLHYLLFHAAAGAVDGTAWLEDAQSLALVMTSANPAAEPLVIDDSEARERLADIADVIAGHDRDIVTRCDDSVVRTVAGAPLFLRRSRGYTPDVIALDEDGPAVLGVGALLKVAPCLLVGREALPGQHVGNVVNRATRTFLSETVDHLTELLGTHPVAIACDRHPDYLTSRWARERAERGLSLVPVQHHHAHLAAVAAEHGITAPLAGLVLDGFGLGDDGSLWGGELLIMVGAACERIGQLAPLALPGGDRAAREPWRVAAGVLHSLGRGEEIDTRFGRHPHAAALADLLSTGKVPVTSACGRLFDAAAALLGVCEENRFEAEAAMRLEQLGHRPQVLAGGWQLAEGVLDLSGLLLALCECDPHDGAALFHGTLAAGLADLVQARLPDNHHRVALTGGCAVNRVLVETLVEHLGAAGIEVILPRRLPPGDGGLALGQALVARRQLMDN